MKQRLSKISVLVRDYDEAIAFYTTVLNFKLVEDTRLSETKRWVVVQPPHSSECALLLAKAASEEQASKVGNQTGGRVFIFLETDDIAKDLEELRKHNVTIIREPSSEKYGTVAVFADLYGNLFDLIQPH